MNDEPLAYHITWTTYGTWLHGDRRGWVEEGAFTIQPGDRNREAEAENAMRDEDVTLTTEQRRIVEQTIRDHCRIRGWVMHALNVRTNHVHVVVMADRTPEEVMNQFKAWASRKLSDHAGLTKIVGKKAGRKKWWTEHGSTKWINDPVYLEQAVNYVINQ